MKSFIDQNYFLKDRWADPKRIKNHPKNCQKSHSFCNFQYEWGDQLKNNKILATPVNQSIPNITLPKQRQRIITVNYDSMTQQDLDDWVAQSLNRNITSFLNPQKKFYLPAQLQDDLKHRYKSKSHVLKGEEDSYFQSKIMTSKKKYYGNKKNKLQISDLYFDYKQLEPKHTPGIQIKVRQNKNKKIEIKRRNAVFLDQDIHYGRLIKDFSKVKEKTPQIQTQSFLTQTDTMFYSYNIDSLNRKFCKEQTPCSITENQYKRLKQPPKDFLDRKSDVQAKNQKIHQDFRQKIMQKAKNTQKAIETTQINQNNSNNKNDTFSQIKNLREKQKYKFKTRQINKRNSTMTTTSIIDTKSIGKDKTLQKKVLNLLNDMHILSEQIDFQMSELNIHVYEVTLKTLDSRPQTKWVIKAQQKLKQKQTQLSIDCFKQALIIQPQFFVPIFNIASLLQKQKMYFQAKRWFQVCKQFEIDQQNVKFGLAIVSLKQMKFKQCFDIVQDLIRSYQSVKKQPKLVYFYIRALCSKKLRKFELARSDYSNLLKNCKPSNYNFLSNFLFSMVFSKSRRLSLKFDCLSYMNFRQTLQLIYYVPQNKLRIQNEPIKNLAKKLVEAPFFKRFSITLLQKLLQKSQYETIKNDSLIFIHQDQTAIILTGIVVVRNHSRQFDRPQTVSVLKQGGIIGAGKIDNFMNEKSNNWFVAKSDIQLIKFQRKSFNQFWKGQITFQLDFKYNFIKNVSLFKNLPDSTLFSICQQIEKCEFKYGTILFNDCSYKNETISKQGVGFGLGKSANSTDPRFVNMKKITTERKKGKVRFAQLLKKHIFGINEMKFTRLKYPGLYILINGKIQIEDDLGFRCTDLITQRQYFGQNLLIDSDGFHNYGRMVVNSQKAELYHLSIEKLAWAFTTYDKEIMKQNTKNRQSIQTVSFLRGRFRQCQNTRINYKYLLQKDQ